MGYTSCLVVIFFPLSYDLTGQQLNAPAGCQPGAHRRFKRSLLRGSLTCELAYSRASAAGARPATGTWRQTGSSSVSFHQSWGDVGWAIPGWSCCSKTTAEPAGREPVVARPEREQPRCSAVLVHAELGLSPATL